MPINSFLVVPLLLLLVTLPDLLATRNPAPHQGRALHQPNSRRSSVWICTLRLTSCWPFICLVATLAQRSSNRLPPLLIRVLLSHLIALFWDSEASICQQSSALQTRDWAIVRQWAPPASNLPYKACPESGPPFVSPSMLITCVLWKSQFPVHVRRHCAAVFQGEIKQLNDLGLTELNCLQLDRLITKIASRQQKLQSCNPVFYVCILDTVKADRLLF